MKLRRLRRSRFSTQGESPITAGPSTALEPAEVHRRAVSGAVVLSLRGLAVRVLGLVATLLLARLLEPRDFGAVALGGAILAFSTTVADGGLGAGLIRGARDPDRRDLQAVLFAQLVGMSVITLIVVAATYPLGTSGHVTAVMIAAMPVQAFRVPATVLLERSLQYRAIVLTEIVETIVFYCWAILTVLAGWGVWGLATAYPLRCCTGTLMILVLCPESRMRPRSAFTRVRQLLGFGARLQATALTIMVRDLAVNVGTAAIAGVSVLGLWSLAYRIMSIPFLLFDALWRVSFAAMSRLVDGPTDMGALISRVTSRGVVLTGCIVCPLAGSASALVPTLFGSNWAAAADVLFFASAGLIVSGPISVATSGYLSAVNDAQSVLRAVIFQSMAWVGVAFLALPLMGVAGIGLGWLAACVVEAVVLGRAVNRRLHIPFLALLVGPTILAMISAALGAAMVSWLGSNGLSAGAGALSSLLSFVVLIHVLQRDVARDVRVFVGKTTHGMLVRTDPGSRP